MNNKRIGYISWGQSAIMSAVFAVLYCSVFAEYRGWRSMIVSTAAACLILAAAVFTLSVGRTSAVRRLRDRSSAVGLTAAMVLGIYYISGAAVILRQTAVLVSERYLKDTPVWVCVILMGLISGYGALMGTAAVHRMTTVIGTMMVAGAVVFILLGMGDISLPPAEHFSLSFSRDVLSGIFPYAALAISCICITSSGLENRTAKAVYAGILLIPAVSLVMITAVWMCLGDYTLMSDYPAFDALIYMGRNMSFQPDGFFFSQAVLMTCSAGSLLCSCFGEGIGEVIESRYIGCLGAVLASAAASFEPVYEICYGIFSEFVVIAMVIFVIPLAAIVFGRKEK